MPNAGLHVKQPLLGLGETHSLAYSSRRKITCITANVRNRSFRSVLASRRSRRDSLKPQEFGNSLESSRVFNPGCLNLGWSQRFPFTSTCAHNNGSRNVSSPSPESPRFDSERDTEHAELKRSKSVFQDYGKHTNGEEDQWLKTRDRVDSSPKSATVTDSDGDYMKSPRSDSNASDLFREGSDSVWPAEERVEGDEEGANSVGYESWGEESGKSRDSGSSGSVSASAADSLAIGGKEPVYQVGDAHLKCYYEVTFLQ